MDRWRCKTPYLLLSLHVSRVQIRQQRVCNVIVRGVPHVLDDFGHPQRKMLQVSEEQRTVRQSGIQVVAARLDRPRSTRHQTTVRKTRLKTRVGSRHRGSRRITRDGSLAGGNAGLQVEPGHQLLSKDFGQLVRPLPRGQRRLHGLIRHSDVLLTNIGSKECLLVDR